MNQKINKVRNSKVEVLDMPALRKKFLVGWAKQYLEFSIDPDVEGLIDHIHYKTEECMSTKEVVIKDLNLESFKIKKQKPF
tara:strand:+ start:40581 stop:40823 length:243 start_codon:yes stop_codon:yes gene_type:complete